VWAGTPLCPFGNSSRLTICRRPRNYVLVPLAHAAAVLGSGRRGTLQGQSLSAARLSGCNTLT
jgi:hypothetical protein